MNPLKNAIRLYRRKNFWASCGITPSEKNIGIISEILKQKLSLCLKRDIQNIIVGLKFFDIFVPTLKILEKENLIESFLWLLNYLHPSLSFKMEIKGCTEISWFHVRNHKQDIYLVGENHLYPGNSIDFLVRFAKKVECPIDVLIEQSYDTFWKIKPELFYRSNSTLFASEPFNLCTEKGKVPKDHLILEYKNKLFFKKCIKPFKGRVKIWATDIRNTSIFALVSHPTILIIYDLGSSEFMKKLNSEPSWKSWAESVLEFQRRILDFDLARIDIDLYEKKIIQSIHLFYRLIPKDTPVEGYTEKALNQKIKTILNSKDKSHRNLVKSLFHFPQKLVDHWKDVLVDNIKTKPILFNLFMANLLDLYTIIRIMRILEKQKNGYLFFFAGYAHSTNLSRLLEKIPKLDFISRVKCSKEDHNYKYLFPQLCCQEKTKRMQLFQISNFS